MVLEQQQRPIGRRKPQRLLEKNEAIGAKQPFMVRRGLVQRIERDDGGLVEHLHGLHESVGVALHAGEVACKGVAPVVIAHQQDGRRVEAGQHAGEVFVSRILSPMSEIAGDDDEGEIAMIAVDAVDRRREPFGRIEAVDLAAARDEVGIGENNEFHRTMVSRFQAWYSGEPSTRIGPV